MGIMIIPFISSLSDDAIVAVPRALREGSLTMGAGQFCTNPGIAVVIDGAGADAFVQSAATALQDVAEQVMLTDGQTGCRAPHRQILGFLRRHVEGVVLHLSQLTHDPALAGLGYTGQAENLVQVGHQPGIDALEAGTVPFRLVGLHRPDEDIDGIHGRVPSGTAGPFPQQQPHQKLMNMGIQQLSNGDIQIGLEQTFINLAGNVMMNMLQPLLGFGGILDMLLQGMVAASPQALVLAELDTQLLKELVVQ